MAEPSRDMIRPKNYMEDVVFRHLDRIIAGADCCKCPVCRMDVAAYALNRLPSKYVATREGEVIQNNWNLNINLRQMLSSLL